MPFAWSLPSESCLASGNGEGRVPPYGTRSRSAWMAFILMQYNLAPEITASSLSISAGDAGTTGLSMGRSGALHLEKSFSCSISRAISLHPLRPNVHRQQRHRDRQVPVKWNSIAGTVGWVDFRLRASSPAAHGQLHAWPCDERPRHRRAGHRGRDGPGDRFLQKRSPQARGLWRSLMLDYEHYRESTRSTSETRLDQHPAGSYGARLRR